VSVVAFMHQSTNDLDDAEKEKLRLMGFQPEPGQIPDRGCTNDPVPVPLAPKSRGCTMNLGDPKGHGCTEAVGIAKGTPGDGCTAQEAPVEEVKETVFFRGKHQ
jgi:hypothetical protein